MTTSQTLSSARWKGQVPTAATTVIKRVEGFSATPYDDNGAQTGGTWTIGYGSTRDAQGAPVTARTPPVSKTQALALLKRDMTGAATSVQQQVTVALATCEAAALISWTYNLGATNLADSTLLVRLNAGQKSAVPAEMRKWIKQGGTPLLGLLRRRWAEAAIFLGHNPTQSCDRAWSEINTLDDWPAF